MTTPAAPDRYAVLGNPVAHSRSPFIHMAFARATGQVIDYQRVVCPRDGLERTVREFAAAGGRGLNITVPFKFEALRLAARRSARAALAGAANVLRLDAGGWFADNTDGVGLVRDIEQGAGVPLRGLRVLMLGAGGAASGALGPLLAAQPSHIDIVNRSAHKARLLVESHGACAAQHGVVLRALPIEAPGRHHEIVINATSSSLAGDAIPVPAEILAADALVLDMMYGPAAAPFLRWAEAAGANARDGLGMLVEQAAEAFFIFRGVRPQAAPVLAALRQAMLTEADP